MPLVAWWVAAIRDNSMLSSTSVLDSPCVWMPSVDTHASCTVMHPFFIKCLAEASPEHPKFISILFTQWQCQGAASINTGFVSAIFCLWLTFLLIIYLTLRTCSPLWIQPPAPLFPAKENEVCHCRLVLLWSEIPQGNLCFSGVSL